MAAILLAPSLASAQPYWVGQIGDKILIELKGVLHPMQVGESIDQLDLKTVQPDYIEVHWQGQNYRLTLGAARPEPIKKTRLEIPISGTRFQVDGMLEGTQVSWIVDTGSSAVAISETLAARIGIQPEPRRPVVNTAGGLRQGWHAQIARLQIQDYVLKDVDAVILPGDYPSQPLLGLSALERFNLKISAQKMVLEPVKGRDRKSVV